MEITQELILEEGAWSKTLGRITYLEWRRRMGGGGRGRLACSLSLESVVGGWGGFTSGGAAGDL